MGLRPWQLVVVVIATVMPVFAVHAVAEAEIEPIGGRGLRTLHVARRMLLHPAGVVGRWEKPAAPAGPTIEVATAKATSACAAAVIDQRRSAPGYI